MDDTLKDMVGALGLVTREDLDAHVKALNEQAEVMYRGYLDKRLGGDAEWRVLCLAGDERREAQYAAECVAAAERHRVGMIAHIAAVLIAHDKVSGETEAVLYASAIVEKASERTAP